jgi:hypothetical protein
MDAANDKRFLSEELLIPFEISKLSFLNNKGSTSTATANAEYNVTHPEFSIGSVLTFGNTRLTTTPSCSAPIGRDVSENGTCRTECLVQYNRTLFCSNKEELRVSSSK